MGTGCFGQKNQRKVGEPTVENPETIKKTNTRPNSIQDEKMILSLRSQQDNLMQEIKKIQKNIDVYKQQIKQKIDTNRTEAKILMGKKENLQKSLDAKKTRLKLVNNKLTQFDNFKDQKMLANMLENVDSVMLKNDHDDKIQEARLNAIQLADKQKRNNANIEYIANLDKDAGYDSDKELEKYRQP